jgi:hypothetical protein
MVLETLPSDKSDSQRLSVQSRTSQRQTSSEVAPEAHVPKNDGNPRSDESNGDQASPANQPTPTEAIANPHAFVEATADELMHDVFDDVDRMLDKDIVVPPNQPSPAETDPRKFAAIHQNSGGVLATLQGLEDGTLDHDRLEQHAENTTLGSTQSPNLSTVLVRLLLIMLASIGLGIGLAWWMAQRQQAELAQSLGTNSADTVTAPSGAEADGFLNYIVESLEAIDRRYELLARAGETTDTPTVGEAGDEVAAIAEDQDSNGSVEGVERVYIPVYQPPQGTGALPPLASAPLNQATTVPAPVAQSSSTPAPVQNIAPNSTHTLVGTLELGDRSAAIFEYAGSAHRIEIGEQIGSSGWSLVSVSGNEATIRRNGDVRTIFIQQSF